MSVSSWPRLCRVGVSKCQWPISCLLSLTECTLSVHTESVCTVWLYVQTDGATDVLPLHPGIRVVQQDGRWLAAGTEPSGHQYDGQGLPVRYTCWRHQHLRDQQLLLILHRSQTHGCIYTVSQKKLGHFFTAYNFKNIEQICQIWHKSKSLHSEHRARVF